MENETKKKRGTWTAKAKESVTIQARALPKEVLASETNETDGQAESYNPFEDPQFA